MVDVKYEDLGQAERQALKWYAAKFGKTSKKDIESELKHIPDLNKLCEAHQEGLMHRANDKRTDALMDRILSPEQKAERQRLHNNEPASKRGRG